MLEQVRKEAHAAAQQICEAAKLRQGQILVVGCSTSEVTGHKVGSYSSPELGQAIYEGMQEVLIPRGIYLAAQCCEHLNRAIIVEAEAVGQGEICNVVPQPKAGGLLCHGRLPWVPASCGVGANPGGRGPGHWRDPHRDAFEACGGSCPPGTETDWRSHSPGCAGAPQVHWGGPGGLR